MQVFKISYFNRKIHEGFLFLINSVTALVISVSHIDGVIKRGYIKGKPFFFFFTELGAGALFWEINLSKKSL